MPVIDVQLETTPSQSIRARQIAEMYDVPDETTRNRRWQGELPIDAEPWNVGLIVGPSGSGKTQIATHLFGPQPDLEWRADSVLDDFTLTSDSDSPTATSERIATVCSAVGFNTIPAWTRPYRTLSNGERFRVDLARRLLELPDPIVVDEFTSVVDRQVAQIGAHAVQKYIRKNGRKFIALSCHYDIIDWLQPDWTFEPATMTFARRSLQPRPKLEVRLQRTTTAAWSRASGN
jgi:ABC-type glutathione transport system ATPase component